MIFVALSLFRSALLALAMWSWAAFCVSAIVRLMHIAYVIAPLRSIYISGISSLILAGGQTTELYFYPRAALLGIHGLTFPPPYIWWAWAAILVCEPMVSLGKLLKYRPLLQDEALHRGSPVRFEPCAQFAAVIKVRIPNLPASVEDVRDQLLQHLELELVQDEIDRETHREFKDDLGRRLIASGFGRLISFGQPVDELVKESRQRRRITNAALTVAREYERFANELLVKRPPDTSIITDHFSRWNERNVRIRRTALSSIAVAETFLLLATWLTVLLTHVNWAVGIALTIGILVGGWWAYHRFDPHDH